MGLGSTDVAPKLDRVGHFIESQFPLVPNIMVDCLLPLLSEGSLDCRRPVKPLYSCSGGVMDLNLPSRRLNNGTSSYYFTGPFEVKEGASLCRVLWAPSPKAPQAVFMLE